VLLLQLAIVWNLPSSRACHHPEHAIIQSMSSSRACHHPEHPIIQSIPSSRACHHLKLSIFWRIVRGFSRCVSNVQLMWPRYSRWFGVCISCLLPTCCENPRKFLWDSK
jgi:hypothetical protein